MPEEAAPSRFRRVYRRRGTKDCKKLIICVHGMGDQRRNDMAGAVAGLMAEVLAREEGISTQARCLPSGLWEGHSPEKPEHDDIVGFAPAEGNQEKLAALAELAFAEVHWADLPRAVETDGHRLEPSAQWARSVVDRLRQRHDLEKEYTGPELSLGATVVEEVAETLKVLTSTLFLADKAGIFKFDLGELAERYLGDVQQVADFQYVRSDMLGRFIGRIDTLAARCPDAELHFIAHSEGSVLTLLTLLRAMNERERKHPPVWLSRVRSLTTLGSPIDKHLLLWPEMWGWLSEGEDEVAETAPDSPERAALIAERQTHWHPVPTPIRWMNYYDLADPVGYDLGTARMKLELWGCGNFDFTPAQDLGFRRYPLAGKAHVDYFQDTDLFAHLYAHAIASQPGQIASLKNTWWGRRSPVIPFVIVGAIHLLAVLVLHRAMEPDKMSQILATLTTGSLSDLSPTAEWLRSGWGITLSGLLLYGTTYVSRVWSITRQFPLFSAAPLYLIAALLLLHFSPGGLNLGNPLGLSVVVPSAVLILVGGMADLWSQKTQRSPLWALRWQMMFGGAAVTAASLYFLSEGSLLETVSGGLAFMYLWWLGVLVFDLSYVWKRYINTTSKAGTYINRLRTRLKAKPSHTLPTEPVTSQAPAKPAVASYEPPPAPEIIELPQRPQRPRREKEGKGPGRAKRKQ